MENTMEIPEYGLNWISDKVNELSLDAEDLKAKYLAKADEFVDSGMKAVIPDENMFADYVCMAINAELQREKGVPKMNVDYAPIGNYPERIIKSGRASVEMVGIVQDEVSGKKKFSRLQAWEDETKKKMSVEFGKAYGGTVEYREDAQLANAHVCGIAGFTNFQEKSVEWATPDGINGLVNKLPMVKLSEVSKNVSKMLENNGKYFSDSLDLKTVMGMVTNFNHKQKEDGSWWARYSIVDSSFNDDKTRGFGIWVDKDLALSINAGKDSFVKFVGYISEQQDRETNEFSYSMTACGIIPVKIMNGIDQPDEKILARHAENSVSESEAGISIEDL